MADHNQLAITPVHEEQADELATIIGQALTIPPAGMQEWMEKIGRENFRAVWRQDRLAGGLGLIRMGQWFGGVSVPMAGVTAVGIAPEHRGKGVAGFMLKSVLNELYDEGTPISALYPATITLYRRAGYELAGSKQVHEISLQAIDFRDRELEVIAAGPEQRSAIEQLYQQRARAGSGNLDRTPMLWQRIFEVKDKTVLAYLILRDGTPEGYVVHYAPSRNEPLTATEVCVLTRSAGRRALTLLADHRSMVKSLIWRGAPQDLLLYLLPEQDSYKLHQSMEWMLRIVNVAGALQARGYAPDVQAELHLEVRDDILPQNSGRYVLAIGDGQAEVRQGGRGSLCIDIRGLAALYSGYMSPYDLRVAGQLEGPDRDLAAATAIFMGPRPWIAEMF